MRQEHIWDAEAAENYDTPGTGAFAPEVLGPMVERLAELARGGRALEFAVGTGRVAVPLAELGVPVAGIELSLPMIAKLREKPARQPFRSCTATWRPPWWPVSSPSSSSSSTRSRTC